MTINVKVIVNLVPIGMRNTIKRLGRKLEKMKLWLLPDKKSIESLDYWVNRND